MNTKLGKVLTYNVKLPPLKPSDQCEVTCQSEKFLSPLAQVLCFQTWKWTVAVFNFINAEECIKKHVTYAEKVPLKSQQNPN